MKTFLFSVTHFRRFLGSANKPEAIYNLITFYLSLPMLWSGYKHITSHKCPEGREVKLMLVFFSVLDFQLFHLLFINQSKCNNALGVWKRGAKRDTKNMSFCVEHTFYGLYGFAPGLMGFQERSFPLFFHKMTRLNTWHGSAVIFIRTKADRQTDQNYARRA